MQKQTKIFSKIKQIFSSEKDPESKEMHEDFWHFDQIYSKNIRNKKPRRKGNMASSLNVTNWV